ncbi:MAG: hypothetical protein M0P18_10330 [Syntrophales bacterium]|nr:hypothetical protein [Syntrophales bacterium]
MKVDEFNIFDAIEEEGVKPTVSMEGIEAISELGAKQQQLEEKADPSKVEMLFEFIRNNKLSVPTVEAALNLIRSELNEIKSVKLPDLMDSIGMESFTMKSGATISIGKGISVNVPSEKKTDFNSWLIRQGHQALIKNKVVVQFPKEGRQSARRFVKYLNRYYAGKGACVFEEKEEVNAMTLKAFVKRELEKGTKFPDDLIKIFEYRYTNLKGA